MKKADLLLAAIALVAYAVSLGFYVGERVNEVRSISACTQQFSPHPQSSR